MGEWNEVGLKPGSPSSIVYSCTAQAPEHLPRFWTHSKARFYGRLSKYFTDLFLESATCPKDLLLSRYFVFVVFRFSCHDGSLFLFKNGAIGHGK